MFIKFNYKNQKRKTNAQIETIEQLRAKAVETFGEQIIYCDFMYEDEDKELVALVDDIDLETCIEEAQENQLNRINVFIELSSPKTKNARSMSRKRAAQTGPEDNEAAQLANFSSSESETEGEEELDLAGIEAIDSESSESSPDPLTKAQIQAQVNAKKQAKIAKVEAKIAKKKEKMERKIAKEIAKLEAKKNKKLQKLDSHRNSLIEADHTSESENSVDIPADKPWMKHIPKHHRRRMIHKMRHKHHRHHGHHKHGHGGRKHCHKRRGPFGFIHKVMHAFKHGAKHDPQVQQDKEEIKTLVHEIKKTLKPLKHHPKMLLKVLKKSSKPLKEVFEKALNEVKEEHPQFKKNFEEKMARKEAHDNEKLARREQRIKNQQLKQEKRRLLREHKIKLREERVAAQAAKKQEMIAQRQAAQKAQAAKKQEMIAQKAAKAQAETKPAPTPEQKKRNQEIKMRINMLVPIFPNMTRPDLRKEVVKELNDK